MDSVIRLLIENLSPYEPSEDEYDQIWQRFSSQSNVESLVVKNLNGLVIGFGAITFDIHIRGGVIGHIEDIVVTKSYRRFGLGSMILHQLESVARMRGCFRISLECSPENQGFYNANSYLRSGVAMRKVID